LPLAQHSFQVAAGTVIARDNVDSFAPLLSPGLRWAVRSGLRMKIVEPRPVAASEVYRRATAENSRLVSLSSDKRAVYDYIAGLPFPQIDPADPDAAMKIMWNHEYRPFATDDLRARNLTLETGTRGVGGAGMSIERRIVIGDFQRVFYNGRLYVDPRPLLPDNADGLRHREYVGPFRAPFDLRGVGILSFRYLDPDRADDTWLYLPSLRRVRRLSAAQRSASLFGQDIDLDSLFGFSGNVTGTTWRLLGEGVVVGCVHAQNQPVKWGPGSADFVFDDVWEPRAAYVVEGRPDAPQYAYARRVLYIDRETWEVLFADIHDRSGSLWKVWINMFAERPSRPDSAAYGGGLSNPAAVMIDAQAMHATRVSTGGPRGTDATTWSFNEGAMDAGTFTVERMISEGRSRETDSRDDWTGTGRADDEQLSNGGR